MKLPEYTIKKELRVPCANSNDVIEYPPGTLIQPIWNEDFLPEHLKIELEESRKYRLTRAKLVMCQIGKEWYPIEEENIRRNGW